jgi:diaminopimelate decarboxylase
MDYDFATLAKLAQEHGDAFYVLHADRFRANLRALQAAFRVVYPRTTLGYSYKTNYTPLLCRMADEEGCYAEVVSKMEYDLARRLGVAPERILFNGPLKAQREIEEALLSGAVVNLDSSAEVEVVEEIAREHPRASLRIGLRCHLTLEPGHESRFGISAEGGDLATALDRLRSLRNCEVRGLHCHFSTHRTVEGFRTRAEKLVELVRTHFPASPPAALDIGGGFLGGMPPSLRAQFGDDAPSYEEYAQAAGSVFAAAFPGVDAPELILEPGAGVVADVLEFVTRVAVVKRVGTRRVAVTTGSIQNIKARPGPVNQPILAVRNPSGRGAESDGPMDITGYTCMEINVLYPQYPGTLRTGDFLVFGNVGAYTTVFKPPFIRPAPAMLVSCATTGTVSVARRREELDDLLATYTT